MPCMTQASVLDVIALLVLFSRRAGSGSALAREERNGALRNVQVTGLSFQQWGEAPLEVSLILGSRRAAGLHGYTASVKGVL